MRNITRREFNKYLTIGILMGTGLITPHFSIAEMQCRCNNPNCERKDPDMNSDMMKMLEELRLATFALPVSSGARCLDHDISISPKKNKLGGVHVQSVACDVLVGHLGSPDVLNLIDRARASGFSGLGVALGGKFKDRKKRFLHLDARHLLPEDYGFGGSAVWSY